jgi:glutamate racemase
MSLFEFRAICPSVPAVFFADKENAPYGNKGEREIAELVSGDIKTLMDMGASRVLMACCTASTVHHLLPSEFRDYSIPIIEPVAREAVEICRGGRIGVISTEATKRSGAFVKAIKEKEASASVISLATPRLVSLAELCGFNGCSSDDIQVIKESVASLRGRIDVLILGCTHFGYFEREIENILDCPTVNSARVGAVTLMKHIASG